MAAGVFSLGAVVLLGAVGIARAPVPAVERDPVAARDLIALMRVGEGGSWLARYDFTRTLANGRSLRQPMSEARNASIHVLISGSAMTVERGNREFDCNLLGERVACHESATGRVLPASTVLRVAVSVGAYDVSRGPSATIAGQPAQCFRILGTGRGQLDDIGTETDMCFSASGVPLSQRVVHPTGAIDERVARSVEEPATTRTIEALRRSFGPDAALGQP
jgi:hypothetical protein